MNKIISKPFFAVVLFLVTIASEARQEPPQPAPAGGPAPGLPINENIYLLVFISVIFGIYKIYNYKNLKTSK